MTQITPAWSLLTWDVVAGRVFLNHGSFGLAPRELRLWCYALLDRIERDPVAFLTEALPQQLAQTRAALAVLVGAFEERLALVPSWSEVLAYDHAYNATLNLLRFAAEQRCWSLRLLPLPWPLEDPQQACPRTFRSRSLLERLTASACPCTTAVGTPGRFDPTANCPRSAWRAAAAVLVWWVQQRMPCGGGLGWIDRYPIRLITLERKKPSCLC